MTDDSETPSGRTRRASGRSRLVGYAVMFAAAALAGWSALALAPLRIYHAQTGNMVPTLAVGERFLVRVRLPICPSLVVDRGDIIVIRAEWAGSSSVVVTRAIGFAGDHIVIDASGLMVNDERITESTREPLVVQTRFGHTVHYQVAWESFAGTSQWRVLRHQIGRAHV